MIDRRLCLASIFIACVSSATAQDCREVAAMAQMVRTKSSGALSAASQQAGESYAARLVYAYRLLQLRPRSKESAQHLLKLIPSTEAQQSVVMTLGDMLCNREGVADMTALSHVNEGLPRELARAVLLSPSFLP